MDHILDLSASPCLPPCQPQPMNAACASPIPVSTGQSITSILVSSRPQTPVSGPVPSFVYKPVPVYILQQETSNLSPSQSFSDLSLASTPLLPSAAMPYPGMPNATVLPASGLATPPLFTTQVCCISILHGYCANLSSRVLLIAVTIRFSETPLFFAERRQNVWNLKLGEESLRKFSKT